MLQVNFIRSGSHRGYRFRNDLCLSFFQLTQLLNAGFGIERAIHDLADLDVASSVRRLWLDISSRINSGQSLPDAMQHHQDAFDQTSIALIDAAHVNGQLSLACQSIHEYLQWQLDARSRMRTALIYPVFSLSVLLSVIVFLLVVVVPSMKGILLSGEASIAWHTQGLLWLSDWLTQYLLHSMVAASVLVGITHLCVKTLPTMRLIWDSLVLRLPLIGSLIVNLSLSRYSRCCAQLYGSSVSLERSLLLAEATVSNQILKADLATVRISLVRGIKLADALQAIHSLPVLFKKMVSIGESSGVLEGTLIHLSRQQNMIAELALKRVEQLTGPIIMMVAGTCLLWVVVSVFAPVYDAAIQVVLSS